MMKTVIYQCSYSHQSVLWCGVVSWKKGKVHWWYWSIQVEREEGRQLHNTRIRCYMVPLHNFYQKMSEEWGIVLFQEDGASCHCAKSAKAWLKTNSILLFAHPTKSQDLSPIKFVWHTMKSKLRARTHLPTSLKELKVVTRAGSSTTPDQAGAPSQLPALLDSILDEDDDLIASQQPDHGGDVRQVPYISDCTCLCSNTGYGCRHLHNSIGPL